jgi:hypothetical protein
MPRETRAPLADACAGAALGALTGLVIGLSITQIVGQVLTAVLALVGAFFGLAKSPTGSGDAAPAAVPKESAPRTDRPWRLAAFGLLCAVGLLVGIWLRTQDVLAEPIGHQIARLTTAGFSPEEARALVVYQRFGIAPSEARLVSPERLVRMPTALFGSEGRERCAQLAERRYGDALERQAAYARAGGDWKVIAEAAGSLTAEQRALLLQAAWKLACGE